MSSILWLTPQKSTTLIKKRVFTLYQSSNGESAKKNRLFIMFWYFVVYDVEIIWPMMQVLDISQKIKTDDVLFKLGNLI